MNRKNIILLAAVLVFLGIVQAGEATNARAIPLEETPPAVILFIGDGMGETHRTAARWYSVGQSGQLSMDTLPISGWSQTASADNPITDSAAAATAMATGTKTNNGVIGMNPEGASLTTILESAQIQGLAVGLVTTVQVSHATPASFAAHVPDRNQMTEIARQTIEHRPNVLLGGGEDEFLPSTETGCFPEAGERSDGRNLISEAAASGYTYVCDAPSLEAVDPLTTDYLLGLFADEGMIRPFTPSLTAMTAKAIDILSQDPDGFFLMVEGGQIDWAAHANEAENVITDTLDLDSAVEAGLAYAAVNPHALVIVIADHETGGMSIGLSSSGLPDEDGPFYMPDATPFYVNWTTTNHTGIDVPTTSQGYLSDQLSDTFENTYVYRVMRSVIGWESWLPVIQK